MIAHLIAACLEKELAEQADAEVAGNGTAPAKAQSGTQSRSQSKTTPVPFSADGYEPLARPYEALAQLQGTYGVAVLFATSRRPDRRPPRQPAGRGRGPRRTLDRQRCLALAGHTDRIVYLQITSWPW